MEAVGRLAGGIAHDFNNLLTTILGYTHMILTEQCSISEAEDGVAEIHKAAAMAAALTKRLLLYSRREALSQEPIDINSVIASVGEMLRKLIGEDIELRFMLKNGVRHIIADRGRIERVFTNLAVNARDAMPEGGVLIFETRNEVFEENQLPNGWVPKDGAQCVLLRVTDSGCGIDTATQNRIFEPYFTTKQAEKGTGLGLSTVSEIVEQIGGNIRVASELGKGTVFELRFQCDNQGGNDERRL